MGNTLSLSGRVYNDAGELYGSGLTITLYNAATSAQVGSPLTPATGIWEFTGLDDTITYKVEIRNGQSKRVIYCGTKQQLAELQVTGGVRFKNTLAIEGATSGASFSFSGNGSVGGTLGVTGATTLNGLTLASGNIAMAASATVDGVDISAFKSAYDAHAADPNGHHTKSHAHNGSDGSGTVGWASISGKPSTFPPSATLDHGHTGSGDGGTLNLSSKIEHILTGKTVHIESGAVTLPAGSGAETTVTFGRAFAATPNVFITQRFSNMDGNVYPSAVSATQVTFKNGSYQDAPSIFWLAIGRDN